MSERHEWRGAQALALVLSMTADGRQRSFFPRSRARGLNLIALSLMPTCMPVDHMKLWLRAFQRSGHVIGTKRRTGAHP